MQSLKSPRRLNRADCAEQARSPPRGTGAPKKSRIANEKENNKFFGTNSGLDDVDFHSVHPLNPNIIIDQKTDAPRSSIKSSSSRPRSVLRPIANDLEEEEELTRIYNDSEHRIEAECNDATDWTGRQCIPAQPLNYMGTNVEFLEASQRNGQRDNVDAPHGRLTTGSRSAFQVIKSRDKRM
jgi:hypothetical protein